MDSKNTPQQFVQDALAAEREQWTGEKAPSRLTAFTVYADSELRDQDGKVVAIVPRYQHDVATRIAACWNACQGISTYWLEGRDSASRSDTVPLDRQLEMAVAQGDELLATLSELMAAEQEQGKARGGPWVSNPVPRDVQRRVFLAWQAAHAVVAKLSGGASHG